MIQAIVARLSQNSFLLKGWAVTVLSGLLAVSASLADPALALLAVIPATMFWFLDADFLRQERLFRRLYDSVRILAPEQIDYDMSTAAFVDGVASTIGVMASRTLAPFYGVMAGVALIVALALQSA